MTSNPSRGRRGSEASLKTMQPSGIGWGCCTMYRGGERGGRGGGGDGREQSTVKASYLSFTSLLGMYIWTVIVQDYGYRGAPKRSCFFSLGRLGTTSHAMQAATVTGEQPFRSRFFFSVGPTLSAHDAVLTAFPLRNTAPLLLLRLLRRRKRARARERERVCVCM